MRKTILLSIIAIFLIATPSTAISLNPSQINHKNENRDISAFRKGDSASIIIGLKQDKADFTSRLYEVSARYSGSVTGKISIREKTIALSLKVPWSLTENLLKEIASSDYISYIEPNWPVTTQFVPNDPSWGIQWGPKRIQADWAWNTTTGSKDVLVAVVDTGVDWDHPDLAANYVALGYDWVNNDSDPMDDNGHGTHCAGIIAAVINNGIGIAGVSNVTIMAEKCLDASGSGTTEDVAEAVIHAVDQGADIISMSLGSYYHSELLHQAIRYAYNNGVLIVAAAGNSGISAMLYPAAYEEVIAVSATRYTDGIASFSNYGEWIEVAAPGDDIYSTIWNNGYAYLSGTSMAAPHVSGVAALIWSQFPDKTRDWVRLQLRYTSDDLGSPGFDKSYGYGRINAKKAVEQSPPTHDIAIYSWATPTYLKPETTGTVNVTLLNFGSNAENDLTIQLEANGTIVDTEDISSLAISETKTVTLSWTPTTSGRYNITVFVNPIPEESNIGNNKLSKYIHVGKPYKAVVVDSEGNWCGYEIRNWDRLNYEWHLYGDTMIYVDYTSLRKQDITYADMAATEADMLIISSAWSAEVGFEFTDDEINAIKQYVDKGHGIIITEASFHYRAPNNGKLASLVGINSGLVWNITQNVDSLQLLEPQHPIFKNIPNPYYFPRTSGGISTDGRWDANELAGGKYIARDTFQTSAIVVYKRGRTYISPWLEATEPYKHTKHLQLLYNAITWSPHEVATALESPSFVLLGNSAVLNATASNIGATNETNVVLKLLINGTVVDSATITELKTNESYTINYLWTPAEGIYNVTSYVQPVKGETYLLNNSVTRIVRVTQNRDVAITGILCPNSVYSGKPVNVTVVASNIGEFEETFDVTLYYNTTIIGTQTVTNLAPGYSVNLVFTWNTAGVQCGRNYILKAEATPVLGEGNLENNILTVGPIKMRMLGDVNGNRKIDIFDVVAITSIYGKREGDPSWNPDADLTVPWGVINIFDVVVVTSNYGRQY